MLCQRLGFALGGMIAASVGLAAEHVVEIRDYTFRPQTLQIKVGDTVRWINKEKRTSHSVLFKGAPALESERMFPDETWTRRFEAGGRHAYTCGPHPEMQGVVEVTEVLE